MTILGHFCLMGIFSKKSGCPTELYMDQQHHAKLQERLMSQFQEKLQRDGRTDRRTEGRAD